MKRALLVVSLAFGNWVHAACAGYLVLHEFDVPGGRRPESSVVLIGQTLYGATQNGGDNNKGTIYKIETDGSGFSVVHDFGPDAVRSPYATPLVIGSTLYGTTRGPVTLSGVYKVNLDGGGFDVLHKFVQSPTDGMDSLSPLTLVNSVFYGATRSGGAFNGGALFRMNMDGSGFVLIHDFPSAVSDDVGSPAGRIEVVDGAIYGMAHGVSGGNQSAVVFKVNVDGTGYSELYQSYPGGSAFGYGGVTVVGSTLYGGTLFDGAYQSGTLFKMNTDGGGFALVHEFSDDQGPNGDLTIVGSTIYGTTGGDGVHNLGTVFRVNTDGTGFAVLHEFMGADGQLPNGPLVVDGQVIYGTTLLGGANDGGVLFAIVIPEPTSLALALIGLGLAIPYAAQRCRRKV